MSVSEYKYNYNYKYKQLADPNMKPSGGLGIEEAAQGLGVVRHGVGVGVELLGQKVKKFLNA